MEKRDFDGSNAASAVKTLFRSLVVALARFVGGAVAAIAWVASAVRRAWRWGPRARVARAPQWVPTATIRASTEP